MSTPHLRAVATKSETTQPLEDADGDGDAYPVDIEDGAALDESIRLGKFGQRDTVMLDHVDKFNA